MRITMKKTLKLLNPFIFMFNMIKYSAHLEEQRFSSHKRPYDFSKDLHYF